MQNKNRMISGSQPHDLGPAVVWTYDVLFVWRVLSALLVSWLAFASAPATALFAQGGAPVHDQPLVTQTIRYRIDGASEVFLAWGINGWTTISDKLQPPGTLVRDGLMYTPMTHVDGVFVANIQVPQGAIVDYVFQITKTSAGDSINVWDTNGDAKQDYHTYTVENGFVEVQSTAAIARQVNPNFVDTQLIWYAILAVAGVGAIVAVLIVRRRLRNPYLDF